ncbi:MAG: phosphate ABC transporter permease PstA [Acidimicrobiia bacterium]|nr:phosphate ABC transporter permease PstA [Acidimicrobiia bacterium]
MSSIERAVMAFTTVGAVARGGARRGLVGTSGFAKLRTDIAGGLFKFLILSALLASLLILGVLLIDTIVSGWSQLSTRFWDFLNGSLRSRSIDDRLGVQQGLYGSFWIGAIVACTAFPIGVGAAIYLEEYALRSRLTATLELVIRNLAGVPSVVYGLLGLFLFVERNTIFGFIGLGWLVDATGGRSVLSAGLTLSVLVLPIVIITAQEAVRAVPVQLKEGAYGLGATKSEMVRTQVLPYAAPGILTGTLLAMSRAIGEAAPLILVGAISGGLTNNPELWDASALREKFTALPIIIVEWVSERGRDPGFADAAAAAIVVLLALVLLLNMTAILLRNYFERKRD